MLAPGHRNVYEAPLAAHHLMMAHGAAVQAYLEWMPIRDPAPSDPFGVKRSFAFGDLATLVMPETRLKARSEQLSLGTDLEMQVLDEAGKIVTDAAMLKTLDRKALPVGYRLEPDVAGFRRAALDVPAHSSGPTTLLTPAAVDTSAVTVSARVPDVACWRISSTAFCSCSSPRAQITT